MVLVVPIANAKVYRQKVLSWICNLFNPNPPSRDPNNLRTDTSSTNTLRHECERDR